MKVYSSKDLSFGARQSLFVAGGEYSFYLGYGYPSLLSNNHLKLDLFGETIYITNSRWNIENLQHVANETK